MYGAYFEKNNLYSIDGSENSLQMVLYERNVSDITFQERYTYERVNAVVT